MEATQYLAQKGLHSTNSRREILTLLLESDVALSEKEIRQKLSKRVDRATIYRTLKIFTTKEITHPVVTERSITKYVIKKGSGDHLHFKCKLCDQVICLPEIRFLSYQLPEGYVQDEVNFLVTGTCKECNQ